MWVCFYSQVRAQSCRLWICPGQHTWVTGCVILGFAGFRIPGPGLLCFMFVCFQRFGMGRVCDVSKITSHKSWHDRNIKYMAPGKVGRIPFAHPVIPKTTGPPSLLPRQDIQNVLLGSGRVRKSSVQPWFSLGERRTIWRSSEFLGTVEIRG